MMRYLMKLLGRYFSYIVFLFILGGSNVYAQTTNSTAGNTKPPAKPIKKQVISFEDELIEGNVDKPDLFYLFQKKNFNYKRLIRLRENFFPEMRRSTEDIKRLRGGN